MPEGEARPALESVNLWPPHGVTANLASALTFRFYHPEARGTTLFYTIRDRIIKKQGREICFSLRVGFQGTRGIRQGSSHEARRGRQQRSGQPRRDASGGQRNTRAEEEESLQEGRCRVPRKQSSWSSFPPGSRQSDLPFPAYQHGFEYFHTFNASKHSLAVSGTRSYARCHRTVGNER